MKPFLLSALFLLAVQVTAAPAQTVHVDPNNFISSQALSKSHKVAPATVTSSGAELPLSFEMNQGQADSGVRFLSRGRSYSLFLTEAAAVIALAPATPMTQKPDLLRMAFVGASRAAQMTGEQQQPGHTNYFIGSDASKWHSNVPTYAKVKYQGIYPGVDLVFYGNQHQLEYDFLVAPQADAKIVRLRFAGADRVGLKPNGDISVAATSGVLTFHRPVVYQLVNGQHHPVDCQFALMADNTVGFTLGSYDHSRELIIDPVLAYSTYFGGAGAQGVGDTIYPSAAAIAVDDLGNAYITGQTYAIDFPLSSTAFQKVNKNPNQPVIYVSKMNAAGTVLEYSTFLGGTGGDQVYGIAIDTAGNAYVAGDVFDSDFPTTAGSFQPSNTCSSNGLFACALFLSKLNATGSALVYSTYINASEQTYLGAIAVDSAGHAYIAGSTRFSGFPTTAGAFQRDPSTAGNGFLMKFNIAGSGLIYSTLLCGGPKSDDFVQPTGLAIDAANSAYLTGYDYTEGFSTMFPTTPGAYQARVTNLYAQNAFVTKFNPDASALLYSTFLTGSQGANPSSIAVDTTGHAFVTGGTASTDYPVTDNAFQKINRIGTHGYENAFVSKLNASGSDLVYSTYLGGSGLNGPTNYGDDHANGIAVDVSGDAFVTGTTSSTDFPVTADAFQSTNHAAANQTSNAFVTELNPAGSALLYSTYFGGSGFRNPGFIHGEGPVPDGDAGAAISLDALGNPYLFGTTYSTDLPVTPGVFQPLPPDNAGNNVAGYSAYNAFLAKFAFHGATTTTVTSNTNPQDVGANVMLTAEVDPVEGSAKPAGFVSFLVDGLPLAQVTLDGSSHASYSSSNLPAGQLNVVASYLGSSSNSSSNGTLQQTIVGPRTAAPAFFPSGKYYPTAQLVTLTSATPGATIYYTTDNETPTTASTRYTGPIGVYTIVTLKAVAVVDGESPSAVTSEDYSIPTTGQAFDINYGEGFTSASTTLKLNGGATLHGSRLQLTSGTAEQDSSVFSTSKFNITKFTTDFTILLTDARADGFTFTVQNEAPTAMGGKGSGLGFVTIQKSVAIKFDLYDNAGEGSNSTGIFTSGNLPTVPATPIAGGVDLHSGDPMGIHITYNIGDIDMTITDQRTGAFWSYRKAVDIPSILGDNVGYVGFTASSGAATATQQLIAWTFTQGNVDSPGFSEFFPRQLIVNGSAAFAKSAPSQAGILQLTDGGEYQAGSVFFVNAQYIKSFQNSFTFQLLDPGADGFTFTIQSVGPSALGGRSAGLGSITIPNSVSIKFDLFNNAGEGPNSTGIFVDGDLPTIPSIDLTGSGIDLHSGDSIEVVMHYDGAILQMLLVDARTNATWSHKFSIDIPGVVGGSTAYVGFTGSTGSRSATQDLLSWSFDPGRY